MSAACPYIVKRQHWVDGRLVTEEKSFPLLAAAVAYSMSSGVDAKIYDCQGGLVRYVRRSSSTPYLYA